MQNFVIKKKIISNLLVRKDCPEFYLHNALLIDEKDEEYGKSIYFRIGITKIIHTKYL